MASNPFLAGVDADESGTNDYSSKKNLFLSSSRSSAKRRKKEQEELEKNGDPRRDRLNAIGNRSSQQSYKDRINEINSAKKDGLINKEEAINLINNSVDQQNPVKKLNKSEEFFLAAGEIVKDLPKAVFDSTIGAAGDTAGNIFSTAKTQIKQNEANQAAAAAKNQKKFLDEQVAKGKITKEEAARRNQKNETMVDKRRREARDALKNSSRIDPTKAAGAAATTAANIATFGGAGAIRGAIQGTGKQVAEEIGAAAAKDLTKRTAEDQANKLAGRLASRFSTDGVKKTTAGIANDTALGAGYGALDTATQKGKEATIGDYQSGAISGGLFGGVGHVAGAVAGKSLNRANVASKDRVAAKTDTQVQKKAESYLKTDEKGEVKIDLDTVFADDRELAAKLNDQNWFSKQFNKAQDNVNPLGFARAIDMAEAKSRGINYADLPAKESLERQLQTSRNVEPMLRAAADEKTSTGASFTDLAKKYSPESKEGQAFGDWTLLVDEQSRRQNGLESRLNKKDGFTDEAIDAQIKKVEAEHPEYREDLVTKNEFYSRAANELREGGVISEKEYKDIVSSSDVASPFNRIFAAKEALDRPSNSSKLTGSIAKQTAIKGVQGSERTPIDTSLEPVIQRVRKALEQKNTNLASNMIRQASEKGFIKGSKVDYIGQAKESKAELTAQRREKAKTIRKLEKSLVVSNRQQRKLDSELNQLNKAGVKAATVKAVVREDTRAIKTVTVKTVKEHVKDNAPKTLDDLKNSYGMKAQLLKEYGPGEKGMSQMAADVHNGGWSQLMKLNPNLSEASAKSIASQIMKKPTIRGQKITVTEGQIGKNPSMRTTIDRLIKAPMADVVRIQKKIETREPKLAAKMNQIIAVKQQVAFEKAVKAEIREAEVGYSVDKATGKAFINGLDEGKQFRVELPPRIINSLDKLARNELDGALKIIANINKLFKATWVGVAAPGFVIKSAMWDVAMVAHNSKRGIKTLGPDAVIASIKGLKESDAFTKSIRKEGASIVGASQLGASHKISAESLASTKNVLSRVKYSFRNPSAVIDSLDVFGGKMASMGRLRAAKAEFNYSKKKLKLSDKEAYANAARAYDNVLPDFATMTPMIRNVNAVLPFANASIAGTRSLQQAYRRDPVGTTIKTAAIAVGPAITIAAYNMQSDSGQAFYADMQKAGKELQLDNNLIVVLPGAYKDKNTGDWTGILKWPVSPEFRAINSQAWRTMYGENNAQKFARDTFDFLTGGTRTLSNPIVDIKTIMDGKSTFDGGDLVKGKIRERPNSEQEYSTTSQAGKNIAGGINNINKFFGGKGETMSPIQADAILGNFGVAGKAVKADSVSGTFSEEFGKTYVGAKGEKANDSFFKTYTPLKQRKDRAQEEVTALKNSGQYAAALRKAKEFNSTLSGQFDQFARDYGDIPQDETWTEMREGLQITEKEQYYKPKKDKNK